MKIYSMTATFGKLEHATLSLDDGLNIIEAPNEWGKSTWCAFLTAMFYGIETREKSTKTHIAFKERYAPWSGSPMSGRIDLHWNGRDITIERSSKGRSPMGIFRAYETETGIEIPELTASNCGQLILGVEQSVFERSAFLRFTDLPVTDDTNLRARLNALVSTGDESGTAEALAEKLHDLKIKCRRNSVSGRLPEAQARRNALEDELQAYTAITAQSETLRKRAAELEQWRGQLHNHKAALRYAAAQDDAAKVAEAAAARDAAHRRYTELETLCGSIPSAEAAQQELKKQSDLRRQWDAIQMEEQMLPEDPPVPEPPAAFRGMTPEDAAVRAEADKVAFSGLSATKSSLGIPLLTAGVLALAGGIALLLLRMPILAVSLLGIGLILCITGWVLHSKHKKSAAAAAQLREVLIRRYGTDDPEAWVTAARSYQESMDAYKRMHTAYLSLRGDLDSRKENLIRLLHGDKEPTDWEQVLQAWNTLAEARRDLQQARRHLQTLQSIVKTAQPPAEQDDLTHTEAETDRLLSDADHELRQLHEKLGHCQGELKALGSYDVLQQERDTVNARIEQLELTYAALDYAEKALNAASSELQRRFAPKISKQAQELFSRLTDGRYDRLNLTEDFVVHAGAGEEDITRPQMWRSDGTVDQLYLALRLAVARTLIPDVPLVLDDVMVRFDDRRLAAALEILRQEAEQKQVILFTCHGREKHL